MLLKLNRVLHLHIAQPLQMLSYYHIHLQWDQIQHSNRMNKHFFSLLILARETHHRNPQTINHSLHLLKSFLFFGDPRGQILIQGQIKAFISVQVVLSAKNQQVVIWIVLNWQQVKLSAITVKLKGERCHDAEAIELIGWSVVDGFDWIVRSESEGSGEQGQSIVFDKIRNFKEGLVNFGKRIIDVRHIRGIYLMQLIQHKISLFFILEHIDEQLKSIFPSNSFLESEDVLSSEQFFNSLHQKIIIVQQFEMFMLILIFQHQLLSRHQNAKLEMQSKRVRIRQIVHILILPFENEFDLHYRRVHLLPTHHTILLHSLLDTLQQLLDSLVACRLQEIIMNLKAVFIFPQKFHKFQHQHINIFLLHEVQIKDLKHFEVSNCLLKSTNHSSNFLVTNPTNQKIDILSLLNNPQKIYLIVLHVPILANCLTEHIFQLDSNLHL